MHAQTYTNRSRTDLINLLHSYRRERTDRVDVADRIIDFVVRESTCAERSHLFGHLTGSAWILNEARDKVVLLHHKKLGRWLQPGGHADGEFDLMSVALREAREESGLLGLKPMNDRVFDIDIHEIPEWKGIPAHFHFDVRFLLQGSEQEMIACSEESNSVRWVRLSEVSSFTQEESVLRMVRLTQALSA